MKFLLTIFLIGLSYAAFSQKEIAEDASWTIRERGYAGIGFGGLSFGRHTYYGNYFSVGTGVLAGYMLTSNLSAGLGFEYQYTSYSEQKLRNHVYGGYPFIRYNIKNFFIQFDYDMLFLRANVPNATAENRAERFFGGIGFSNSTRGRTFINFLISYDFLYTNNGIFSSPLNSRLFFTF